MADIPRRPRSGNPTTPENYPTAAPQPSGDYSYTLEIVMNMQSAMGALTEAVSSLKSETKEQRSELRAMSQDMHALKVTGRVVTAMLTALLALVGWLVKIYMDYHKH